MSENEASAGAFEALVGEFVKEANHVVVVGGAGCGKTTAALRKAANAVEGGLRYEHSRALFLSFANATIQRVADQINAVVAPKSALRIEANTYHGFAWSILRSHGHLIGGASELQIMSPADENAFRATMPSDADLEAEFRRLFEVFGVVPFDMFAPLATEILDRHPRLAKLYADAYPIIFLDEFQDTTDSQWGMVRALNGWSQLIALGDPEQRIYAHLKGTSDYRFDDFRRALAPTEFDMSAWNWRSPEGSIAKFGRDILAGILEPPYEAVKIYGSEFPPLSYLKWAVLRGLDRVRSINGTIAILTPTNQLSARVFDYFQESQGPTLPALRLDIYAALDEAFAGTIFIAELLALKETGPESLAIACDALAVFLTTKTTPLAKTNRELAQKLRSIADALRSARSVRMTKLLTAIQTLIDQAVAKGRTGHPYADYLSVVTSAVSSAATEIQSAGRSTRLISVLARGSELESKLADAWREHGSYHGSADATRDAIIRYQLINAKTDTHNLVVMNIHRAKGKEFDEVFIYEDAYTRFVHSSDVDLGASRKNMNVAVTRARRRVSIFTPKRDPSKLFVGTRPGA